MEGRHKVFLTREVMGKLMLPLHSGGRVRYKGEKIVG